MLRPLRAFYDWVTAPSDHQTPARSHGPAPTWGALRGKEPRLGGSGLAEGQCRPYALSTSILSLALDISSSESWSFWHLGTWGFTSLPSAGRIPSLSLSFVFYEMRTIQMCAFLAVRKVLEGDRCG